MTSSSGWSTREKKKEEEGQVPRRSFSYGEKGKKKRRVPGASGDPV